MPSYLMPLEQKLEKLLESLVSSWRWVPNKRRFQRYDTGVSLRHNVGARVNATTPQRNFFLFFRFKIDHAGGIGESGQQESGSTSDAHVVDARNKEQQARMERITIEEYLAIEDKKMAKPSMNSSFEKWCDDKEVLIDDEFFDLERDNLREGNEIAKVFKTKMDIFLFETPLCKEFKDFNHLLQSDVDLLTRNLSGFKTYKDHKNMFKNHAGINNDDKAIQMNQEWFDDHEPIGDDDDDDDILDLNDYLIPKDAPN
nr:hypothetical protein [Tanacetum cinerariifolium]